MRLIGVAKGGAGTWNNANLLTDSQFVRRTAKRTGNAAEQEQSLASRYKQRFFVTAAVTRIKCLEPSCLAQSMAEVVAQFPAKKDLRLATRLTDCRLQVGHVGRFAAFCSL